MGELLAHGLAGHVEPARGFGLIALRQFNGAGEELTFHRFDNSSVSIRKRFVAGSLQELVDEGGHRLLGGRDGIPPFQEHCLEIVDADGKVAGEEQGLAEHIGKLADIAGPWLLLKPSECVGQDRDGA